MRRPAPRSLLAAVVLLLALPSASHAQTLALDIAATPIDRFVPAGSARVGALEFRGGLVLSAASADFGGWSGMVIDPDGAGFIAVSDRGFWLTGRIESEGDRPTGIAQAKLAPMRAANGGPLAGQRRGDVESLARIPGGFVVGIERVQEVWRFDGADPLRATGRALLLDEGLAKLGSNEGPEALLAPPSGTPAALILFSRAGLHGTTVEQIAEQAAVSKTNLFYYFASKEEVYVAALTRLLDHWLDPLRGLELDSDPVAGIGEYIRRKIMFSRTHPEASRLFCLELVQGAPLLRHELETSLKELVDAKAAVIRAWSAAGRLAPVDPHHLIFSIWATTQHYADFASQIDALLQTGLDDEAFAEEAVRNIQRIILDGVRVRADD